MQVLNLARDPRWGRNGEAGAEDPYLMSQYALQFTLGFQNDSAATTTRSRSTGTTEPQLPYLNGVVTLKHWDVGLFSFWVSVPVFTDFVLGEGGLDLAVTGLHARWDARTARSSCTPPCAVGEGGGILTLSFWLRTNIGQHSGGFGWFY